MNTAESLIFVITGPSTVGKSKVIRELLRRSDQFRFIVSHTTRMPRTDEADGVDYYFINEGTFQRMVEEHAFLQWKKSHYGMYGTSWQSIDNGQMNKKIALMDLDPDSFFELKMLDVIVVGIYLLPPDKKTLENRIYKRGAARGVADDNMALLRFQTSLKQIPYCGAYDYVLENLNDCHTAELIEQIAAVERMKQNKYQLIKKWTEEIREETIE